MSKGREVEGRCVCGNKVKTLIKKPSRLRESVVKATCYGCGSKYLFKARVDKKSLGRRIELDAELLEMSEKCESIVKKGKLK